IIWQNIFIFSLKNKSISSYICIICIFYFRNSLILLCCTSISTNLAGEHLTFLNKNAWSNRLKFEL
ncbi:hypothetical protein BpHYR1_038059, partial [Brachionus plicatilis]